MKKFSAGSLAALVIFGASYLISPGLALCILLSAVFFYAVRRNTPEEDRRFVLFMISAALIIKVAGLIILQYKCISMGQLDIFGDAQDNIIQGINISDSIRNMKETPVTPQSILSSRYNTHSMTIFNGIFFLLFGHDIVSLKYINILAISATAWIMYDFAKNVYSGAAGRIALAIILFWPTIFVWSLTDLKESHLLFTVACSFWLLDRAAREKSWPAKAMFVMLSVLFALYFVLLKIKLMFPVFILSASLIVFYNALRYGFSRDSALSRKVLYILIVPAAAALMAFGSRILNAAKEIYALILHYNIGFLNSGGWNVNLLGDQSQNFFTLQFILKYIAKAWAVFFLEPLPWHFYSHSLMATYPMMLAWYIIAAFAAVGVARAYYAGRSKEVFAMLAFMAIYVTVVGMSVANIGTMIRFRDAIVPIMAVFAGIGMEGRCRNMR